MSKKSRRRNKKILAALALAGGAAMLGRRGKGAVTGVVNPNEATTAGNWISKKVVPEVVKDAAPDMTGVKGFGHPIIQGNVTKKQDWINRQTVPGYGVEGPPSILNPYNRHQNIKGRLGNRLKGGGIAKRGTGVALKKGGRVTGIAKRGFGRALMKGKK